MTTEEIIGNTLGAVIGLKVIDTGLKMIDSQSKKTKRGKHKGFL
jgi:hypothetical protein